MQCLQDEIGNLFHSVALSSKSHGHLWEKGANERINQWCIFEIVEFECFSELIEFGLAMEWNPSLSALLESLK